MIVEQRLNSHLIPIKELKAGDYDGLAGKDKANKIKIDYEAFLSKRAKYISKAVEKLTAGEEINSAEITY